MRIYNAKKSQLDLPLAGSRVTIAAHTISKDVLPNDDFLTMIAQSFTEEEIALIVSGPYEINMCAKNPACTPLIVQSLDQAIARFNEKKEEPKKEEEPKVVEEKKEEAPVIEEKQEEVVPAEPEVAPVVEEVAVEEKAPVIEEEVEEKPKSKKRGRSKKEKK